MDRPTPFEAQKRAVGGCLAEMFGLYEPRDFQLRAVARAVFYSYSVLVVQKTGDGKSVVPLATLMMRGGVAIIVVPLLTIGAGQAAAANAMSEDLDAFHWDDMNSAARKDLLARLDASSRDDKKRIALFVSPQAVDGANCPLRTAIVGLLARDAVGVVAVDELHRVPLDGIMFRKVFARLRANLFDRLESSPRRVPVVGMTATLPLDLQEQFLAMSGVKFDVEERGDGRRRNIAISVRFNATTATALKAFVVKHRKPEDEDKDGVKVVLYSNHAKRMKNLTAVVEKVLPPGEDVSSVAGGTGGMMKSYITEAWRASLDPEARTLEKINCTVLVATGAANCGLDCRDCGAVAREGPPAHLIDLLQEMGRIRPQGYDYPYEYLIVLSVATWAALLLRIETTEDAGERKRQRGYLTVVLRLLVLQSGCIHAALEGAFGNPSVGVAAQAAPCGDMCWNCNPGLTLDRGGRAEKEVVLRVLRVHFVKGSSPSQAVVVAIHVDRAKIWPRQKTTTKQHANRLVLQLVASGILDFAVQRPKEGHREVPGSIHLNWAVNEAGGDFAHTEDALWTFL